MAQIFAVRTGCLAALLMLACPCQFTPSWPTHTSLGIEHIYLLEGGRSTEVEVQLLFMGSPYPVDGFNVIFYINDTSFAHFPDGGGFYEARTVGGKANATVVSGVRAGTATLEVWCCDLMDSAAVHVLAYGTISGFVTDAQQHAVPGALVTLWPNASYNQSAGGWAHDPTTATIDPFVPRNPQLSGDGSLAPAGTYTFTDVPLGTYIVEANASRLSGNPYHRYFSVVSMAAEGSATANVVIPDYAFQPPPTTPTASPSPTPTTAETTATTASPSSTTAPATPTTIQQGGVGLIAALAAEVIAVAVWTRGAQKRG